MKKILAVLLSLFLVTPVFADNYKMNPYTGKLDNTGPWLLTSTGTAIAPNVGIGTTIPMSYLDVQGGTINEKWSASQNSAAFGIKGEADLSDNTHVYNEYAGFFKANGTSNNSSYGVWGESDSTDAPGGGYGGIFIDDDSGNNGPRYGVFAEALHGTAVEGVVSDGAVAVSGLSTGGTIGVSGVGKIGTEGITTSTGGKAIHGQSVGAGGPAPNSWDGYFDGGAPVYVKGNLGIGTFIPASLLDVNRKFNVSGSNVGIGSINPGALVHINNGASIKAAIGDGCSGSGNFTGISLGTFFTNCTTYSILGEGTNTFLNAPSGSLFFRSANTNYMTMTSAGNFGIGVSPSSILHIKADDSLLLHDSNGSGFWGYKLRGSGGSTDVAEFVANGTTGEIRIGSLFSSYFPTFYSGNAEAMRILTNGNVGIGATNPTAPLEVRGATGRVIITSTTNGNNSSFQLAANTSGGVTKTVGMWDQPSGTTNYMGLSADGVSYNAALWNGGGLSVGNSYYASNPGANNMFLEGNLGIGNTTASTKLQVTGTAVVDGSVAGYQFNSRSGSGSNFQWYNPSGTEARLFSSSTGDTIAVDTAGNIGVGITAPLAALHLKRSSGGELFRFEGDSAAQTYQTFYSSSTRRGYVGTGGGNTDLVVQSDANLFLAGGVDTIYEILKTNGHHVFVQATAPTASTCGTSPAITSKSSDMAGSVTPGTGSPTSCTITFNQTWVNAPFCTANDANSPLAIRAATSTTTLTLQAASSFGGDLLSWVCFGGE